ncbi:MAG TPA: M1 family aminopeptidase [Terriglobales bacterium]|nr:M1 family aminopeptidase [Terriglobales bacterium]
MRLRRVCPLLGILTTVFPAFSQVPRGIPQQLAERRASQISNIRYRLAFTLEPNAATTSGEEELEFDLKTLGPVLLDFRDGRLLSASLNGADLNLNSENGHLVLPAQNLRLGANSFHARFVIPVAAAGKPLTRFDDHDDNTEYIYSLFVPMDASMAFPCFDQPDLKGRFVLELTAPSNWTTISNTPVESFGQIGANQTRTRFAETRPISTYLFAFAAGPFRKLTAAPGLPPIYVRKSKLARAQSEAPEVQQIAARGLQYLSSFFAQPFPFPQYDMLLIPGFPYGGMEHAGATFLREESVLFRTAPTHSDLLNRDILVLHELTHQWFGDLVTMRWFDDLWLKEGFAQYMAYQSLAALKPDENIWKRFYESIKPEAYAIDSTQGTTPIYQQVPNLEDAKSAYGAIVYSKAPAVLKQLAFILGAEKFQGGLRLYLKEHAYGNAEWSDLVHAFERASGKPLDHWAEMWIRHRGMPQVDVSWTCNGGRLTYLSVSQHDVLGSSDLWPLSMQMGLNYVNREPALIRVDLNGKDMQVPSGKGTECPQFIFANENDYAYGRFLLDGRSRDIVLQNIDKTNDLFLRTLLWGSLWESVRNSELPPKGYLAETVRLLPAETDEMLVRSLLSHSARALHRYLSTSTRREFVPQFERIATDRMLHSASLDLRIAWFHSLVAIAETPQGLTALKQLLLGQLTLAGVELRPLDRWNIVTTVIAHADPDAEAIFVAEKQRDPAGDGPKYAYAAEAAKPDAATKQRYFGDFLHNQSRPEDWIEQSLYPFNYWSQSQLTALYLTPALQALPQIKRERKIFFLLDWLDAFIYGQDSAEAQATVYAYLRSETVDRDLRLKILQAVDELDRSVAIRNRFPN